MSAETKEQQSLRHKEDWHKLRMQARLTADTDERLVAAREQGKINLRKQCLEWAFSQGFAGSVSVDMASEFFKWIDQGDTT